MPSGPSNWYALSTASHGIRRRSAASASRARVSSFSFTSSSWRAASHASGDTIGGVFMRTPLRTWVRGRPEHPATGHDHWAVGRPLVFFCDSCSIACRWNSFDRYARLVVTQTDLLVSDGRTLHAYDALADGVDARLAVFWHHGTPNLGAPPEPLLPAAAERGIRWVSYDRPGYGGSTPHPGRDVASAAAEYDPELFTPADHAARAGAWSWLLTVVEQAMEGGLGGMVDDNLASVAPWGFDPGQVRPPVLFVHGGQDRMVPSSHGEWLARRTPGAELWLRPDDGHVSVLAAAEAALDWLWVHATKG